MGVRNAPASIDEIEVRRIRPDEWDRLRSIRLEALADSPAAFITTLSEARSFPDETWIDRAHRGAAGDDQITVLAVSGGEAVGLAVGLWDPNRSGSVMPIVSVYVSPQFRGRGVGARVMEVVHDWGIAQGATTASLWVVDDNEDARSFYRGIGYELTLDRHRITVPPARWETRMTRPLVR